MKELGKNQPRRRTCEVVPGRANFGWCLIGRLS